MFIYKQNTNNVNAKNFFYEEIKEIITNQLNENSTYSILHALVNESKYINNRQNSNIFKS